MTILAENRDGSAESTRQRNHPHDYFGGNYDLSQCFHMKDVAVSIFIRLMEVEVVAREMTALACMTYRRAVGS